MTDVSLLQGNKDEAYSPHLPSHLGVDPLLMVPQQVSAPFNPAPLPVSRLSFTNEFGGHSFRVLHAYLLHVQHNPRQHVPSSKSPKVCRDQKHPHPHQPPQQSSRTQYIILSTVLKSSISTPQPHYSCHFHHHYQAEALWLQVVMMGWNSSSTR